MSQGRSCSSRFLHMCLLRALGLVRTPAQRRSPFRLSKQARADWQAPARWRHPFIRALTPVSLAPLGRSPWRCQTRELALRAPPFTCMARGALRTNRLRSFLPLLHLSPKTAAAGWDYRPAHLRSRPPSKEEGSSSRPFHVLNPTEPSHSFQQSTFTSLSLCGFHKHTERNATDAFSPLLYSLRMPHSCPKIRFQLRENSSWTQCFLSNHVLLTKLKLFFGSNRFSLLETFQNLLELFYWNGINICL